MTHDGDPFSPIHGSQPFGNNGGGSGLGPKPEPRKGKRKNGAANPWSPVIARYIYRQADGTPYLRVCRTADKDFSQYKWNGQMWVSGKPTGPKIPYRLPELMNAPLNAPVHITEGEKDTDTLVKLGFIATTNSEGAENWTDDLDAYFKYRHVYIHEDNDNPGRKRVQRIARALHSIAASVRIIRLPGLLEQEDVSDWLRDDPSGARLVRHCEKAPVWEPSRSPADEEAAVHKTGVSADRAVKTRKHADILIDLASSVGLFHDHDDVGYARFDVNGHKENWPIRSKALRRWLTRCFYQSTGTVPNSEAMHAVIGVLEARAQFDAPEQEVYVRVAGSYECIYIDLADSRWRSIEIDKDGWRILDNPLSISDAAAG